MSTTRLFFRWQKMLLKMKILYCPKLPQRPKFPHLTVVEVVPLLSPPKKLTSSTANLEWCHVHLIRDSYSTFIHRVIGSSKNSMELFFNAKFDFKSTRNRDSTTSHHKHPVCQSHGGDAEKLTNVWSRYFGTNRIIDNWLRCLGLMWRKRKNDFDKWLKTNLWTVNFISLTHNFFTYHEDFS